MEDHALTVRSWRIVQGIPSGLLCWFDPSCEEVRIYRTAARLSSEDAGIDQAHDLAKQGQFGYLDKVGSVSASEPSRVSDDSSRDQMIFSFEEAEDLPF